MSQKLSSSFPIGAIYKKFDSEVVHYRCIGAASDRRSLYKARKARKAREATEPRRVVWFQLLIGQATIHNHSQPLQPLQPLSRTRLFMSSDSPPTHSSTEHYVLLRVLFYNLLPHKLWPTNWLSGPKKHSFISLCRKRHNQNTLTQWVELREMLWFRNRKDTFQHKSRDTKPHFSKIPDVLRVDVTWCVRRSCACSWKNVHWDGLRELYYNKCDILSFCGY